jgi:hypothetical protein
MNCSLSRLVGRLLQVAIDRKEVLDDRRTVDLGEESLVDDAVGLGELEPMPINPAR